MNSLLFNFARRSILVPLVVTLLAVSITCVLMPKLAASSNKDTPVTANEIDVAQYSLTDYNSFSELEDDTYIGNISVPKVNINCAVIYNSNTEIDALNMISSSTEPWGNGAMVVTGTNTKSQLNYLHRANIGDEIDFEPYKHSYYQYKISDIIYGVDEDSLESCLKENTLVLCLPYTDFYDADDENLYTVYIADLVNGGDKLE
ncbi:MAG: sortase domain-bontaining protein [Eubacterium sp.]